MSAVCAPGRELSLTLIALHAEAMAEYRALRYAAELHPEPLVRRLWSEAAARALADACAITQVQAALTRAAAEGHSGADSRSTSCVPLPVAAA